MKMCFMYKRLPWVLILALILSAISPLVALADDTATITSNAPGEVYDGVDFDALSNPDNVSIMAALIMPYL